MRPVPVLRVALWLLIAAGPSDSDAFALLASSMTSARHPGSTPSFQRLGGTPCTRLRLRSVLFEGDFSQCDPSLVASSPSPLLHLARETAASVPAGAASPKAASVQVRRDRRRKTERRYQSMFGLPPAASQVYHRPSGLSIGGYGEFHVERQVKDRRPGEDFNTSDFARYVQYVGYRFSKHFVFNAAVEFQHASTLGNWESSSGAVNLEFGYMDLLLHRTVNLRAGILLVPMGMVNRNHEPLAFHGVLRPAVEQVIIPSTWSELGAAVFGEPFPGLTYQIAVTGGFNGSRFQPYAWRDGRQGGNNPLGESVGFVAHLEYAVPGTVRVGASFFGGGAGQNQPGLPADPEPRTFLGEIHFDWRFRGLELRALFAYGVLEGSRELTLALFPDSADPQQSERRLLGDRLYGWYAEIAYDIWPLISKRPFYLAPYFRFERYNTQHGVPEIAGRTADGSNDITVIEGGITFRPHPQIVVKATYRDTSNSGTGLNVDSWLLGGGFRF